MMMNPATELILQLAAQEALAAQFSQIEPEHLLMALLKLAELPPQQLQANPDSGDNNVQEFLTQCEAVRCKLRECRVESTPLRRKLRARLGKGGSSQPTDDLHRSPACRKVFDEAGDLAKSTGAEAIAPIHLLEAILLGPTPLIKEFVGDHGRKSPSPSAESSPVRVNSFSTASVWM